MRSYLVKGCIPLTISVWLAICSGCIEVADMEADADSKLANYMVGNRLSLRYSSDLTIDGEKAYDERLSITFDINQVGEGDYTAVKCVSPSFPKTLCLFDRKDDVLTITSAPSGWAATSDRDIAKLAFNKVVVPNVNSDGSDFDTDIQFLRLTSGQIVFANSDEELTFVATVEPANFSANGVSGTTNRTTPGNGSSGNVPGNGSPASNSPSANQNGSQDESRDDTPTMPATDSTTEICSSGFLVRARFSRCCAINGTSATANDALIHHASVENGSGSAPISGRMCSALCSSDRQCQNYGRGSRNANNFCCRPTDKGRDTGTNVCSICSPGASLETELLKTYE